MAGTNAMIGGGGFHHVAIKVRDFDSTVAFFQDVLGFTEKISWTMDGGVRAMMLDTGDGNYVEVFGDPDYDVSGNDRIFHVAFRTTDVDAATNRCRDAGCKVTMGPADVNIPSEPPTPVRISFVEGPEGVVIEFFDNEVT